MKQVNEQPLTLPAPFISESCMKIKIYLIFIFTILCGASTGLMKAFKAFIKPFETPQRSMKIKLCVNFFPSFAIGTGRVNKQCSRHIETSQLICSANPLTGFYMMGTLVVKRLTPCQTYIMELAITCSKLTIETLEQYVKYVQN